MVRVKTLTLEADTLHQNTTYNDVFYQATITNMTTANIYVGIDQVAVAKGDGCRVVLPGQSRNINHSGYNIDILGTAEGDVEIEVL